MATRGTQILRSVGWAMQVALARLRFLLLFAAVFAVIGGWEAIRSRWLRWTAGPVAEAATSSDTEFFCPMDPGVLSDWPSKCPVCNMTLVRRRRGDAGPLPNGVLARMQVTPYRLTLGGIETAPADYAPLARTLDLPGTVREVSPASTRIEAEASRRELRWIAPEQATSVAGDEGTPPVAGTVVGLPEGREPTEMIEVRASGDPDSFRVGDRVTLRLECPVDRSEPFASQPTEPPPLRNKEPRQLFICMGHPDVVRDAPGRCPRDSQELMPRPVRDDQRVRWWCPMHPAVVADQPGATCEACGGMVLVPRVISYRPRGRVLAVPDSAAIDDGSHAYVFVDRGAGMFEARVVTLGPRCGNLVAVADGLEPGERVVARGAFLLDAETRLNPSLASGYFGAAGATRADRPAAPEPPPSPGVAPWLAGLPEVDRPLALRQKTCPITGKDLGSMGVPPRVAVRGRTVFVCCAGCTGAVEADPETTLSKLPPPMPGPRP